MATHSKSVLGANTIPDTSGFCFWSPLNVQLSMTNSVPTMCLVMQDPNGGGDSGFYAAFRVPQNYSSSPVLHIQYVIDGTPTNVVAFGCQSLPLTDSEAVDAALGTEDTASNSTWTGYADEDLVEESITLSNLSTAAGEWVEMFIFIDDGTHTFAGNVLVVSCELEYSD